MGLGETLNFERKILGKVFGPNWQSDRKTELNNVIKRNQT